MVLLVAFSFVHKSDGPSKCNRRIANSVLRVTDAILRDGKQPVLIVAEYEVYEQLIAFGLSSEYLIGVSPYQTIYSGSYGVWDEARNSLFGGDDITEIVFVANRKHQLREVKRFPLKEGYRIGSKYEKKISRVGYDWKADNKWARSWIHLWLHSIKQRLTGLGGG